MTGPFVVAAMSTSYPPLGIVTQLAMSDPEMSGSTVSGRVYSHVSEMSMEKTVVSG